MNMSKESKWKTAVGKRCKVEGYCNGEVVYYGDVETEDGHVKMVGVALDKPLGDGDGAGYFECADGHAVFAFTKEVKLLDADGKTTTKKKTKAPAKKWESPPSLRKTIGRGPSTPKGKSTKSTTPKKTMGAAETRKAKQAKSGSSAGPQITAEMKAEKKVTRKPPVTKPADDDRTGVIRPPPKPTQEELEAQERERQAAEEKAAEERLAESLRRQKLEEEAFLKQQEEEANRREALRVERREKREREAAERAAKLEAAEKEAEEKVAAVYAAQLETKSKFEEKARQMQEKREAQRARIAALMANVKGAPTA